MVAGLEHPKYKMIQLEQRYLPVKGESSIGYRGETDQSTRACRVSEKAELVARATMTGDNRNRPVTADASWGASKGCHCRRARDPPAALGPVDERPLGMTGRPWRPRSMRPRSMRPRSMWPMWRPAQPVAAQPVAAQPVAAQPVAAQPAAAAREQAARDS